MNCSILFKQNYNSAAHIVINQGGTSSGKTYAVEQVLFCIACNRQKQVITVVGQDIPNLKAGALRDALAIYNDSIVLQQVVKSYNKSDRIFEFHNGSIMEFKSFDNAQDAKSGKRDYLFVNEANGIPWDVNEGTGALANSSLLALLNQKNYSAAAEHFLLWDKITDPETGAKILCSTLTHRREEERKLFLSPEIKP
jgi:hypothetical protein